MRATAIFLLMAAALRGQTDKPVGSLHGILRDQASGAPLGDFTVEVEQRAPYQTWATRTGPDGVYTVSGLLGSVRISARYGTSGKLVRDSYVGEGQDVPLDLVIPTIPRLSGKVFDENGKPARGATMWLLSSSYRSGLLEHDTAHRAVTTGDGKFAFDADLEPQFLHYGFVPDPVR